jgi:hypothetical protein
VEEVRISGTLRPHFLGPETAGGDCYGERTGRMNDPLWLHEQSTFDVSNYDHLSAFETRTSLICPRNVYSAPM